MCKKFCKKIWSTWVSVSTIWQVLLDVRTQHFATCEGSNLKEVQGSNFSSSLAARLLYWKGIDFLLLLCEKDFRNENNLFFLKDSVQGRMNGRFACRNYSRGLQFITSICWHFKGLCISVKIKRYFTRIIRLSRHVWVLAAVYVRNPRCVVRV